MKILSAIILALALFSVAAPTSAFEPKTFFDDASRSAY
jgi:hypothetical protein